MPPTTRANVLDLRRTNRRSVFEQLFFRGSLSRLDISSLTGLSAATVTNIVAELLNEGLIVETGSEESQGGRPRTMLSLNPAYGYFIGVDVGEPKILLELFDLKLNRIQTQVYSLTEGPDKPQQLLTGIVQGVYRLLEICNVPASAILGVGIAVPGVIDKNGNLVAPGWGFQPIPLMAGLVEALPFPLFVENAAKTRAQAEMWFGAGQGAADLAVLLVSTGLGGSLITESSQYQGTTNNRAEWGHSTVVMDGWLCRCGNKGCLEAYVGAPGIIRRLRETNPAHPALQQPDRQAIFTALVESAQGADPAAVAVLTETARYLGAGIATVINLLTPQCVVLSGWVGDIIGPYILDELKAFVAQAALPQPFAAATLTLSQLGSDALCLGAATIAVEKFFAVVGQKARPAADGPNVSVSVI